MFEPLSDPIYYLIQLGCIVTGELVLALVIMTLWVERPSYYDSEKK